MGCGACSNFQVADSSRSLHTRLTSKLSHLRDCKLINDLQRFVSIEQIKAIENALQPPQQTIRLQQLHRLQAGEYLLTKQRRTAWKIAIYQPNKDTQIPPFLDNPTPKHQTSKNRFHQISLDINRTFPKVNQLNRSHLTIVLQNISLYYEAIGYTQGMNFLVGFLLLCGFAPKQAFQIFIRLSQSKSFLMIRNFSENFKNVNCCVKIMQQIMKQSQNTILVPIINKIESMQVNLFLFVFSWFLSYFLYNFNLKASLLIWDYIILFPIPTPPVFDPNGQSKQNLFGVGFANSINFALKILQSLGDKLLACSQLSGLMNILRHDAIEQLISEEKAEQLLSECRRNPLLDWLTFKSKCQQADQQLYNIITDIQDIQSSKANKGHFVSFMNECKVVKRSQENAFQ